MSREKPTYRGELERLDAAFPGKEILSNQELADYLGVCKDTVRRRLHDCYNPRVRGYTKNRIASVLAE